MDGGEAYFDLEEVFWRSIDLVEGLLAGLWNGLHFEDRYGWYR